MKKRITAIVLVLAMSLGLIACGGEKETKETEKELTKITFVLDWTPSTNHTGLYVAQSEGYYEEAFYTPVIIGNTEWMAENEETTKAFLAATAKGYEYAIENPEEAADILLEAAPELDEALVKASQEYLKDEYKAEVEQWGYIDPARWNAFYNWINESGLSEVEIPENTGFNDSYLEN